MPDPDHLRPVLSYGLSPRYGESPHKDIAVLALFAILLCIFAPGADLDRDGFSGCDERAVGCDPFDAESYPVCADLDGDGVGEWPLIAPRCSLGEGLAPCA